MRRQDGYIIERIIDSRQKKLCYSGQLVLEGVSAPLCGPLTLRGFQVIGIDTYGRPCRIGTTHIVLRLLCEVADRYGQCGQGYAHIDLESCPENMCVGTVHHSAQVVIQRACYTASDRFEIQASICLLTVVSRAEIVGCNTPRKEKNCCPCIPMYPRSPLSLPYSEFHGQ